MGQRAKGGAAVFELVRLAMPMLQQADRQSPRTGPGDTPDYPDWFLAGLILIALLYKKKTKSAQYRFLAARRVEVTAWLGFAGFPSRATYFRRYRQAHRLYRQAIVVQGRKAIQEGLVDPQHVAGDKSLVTARGEPWHTWQRRAGQRPRGADGEAAWGYSEHHGWVYGYSYEVVVSATADSLVFPLVASVDTAKAAEVTTFAAKVEQLPAATEAVLLDAAYDGNELAERVEYNEHGQRTGRRCLCPHNPRNTKGRKLKEATSAAEVLRRQRRALRQRHLLSQRGRRVYRRRSKTVEPFNQWLKDLFEVDQRVWHRGLSNNQTQLLGAVFAYQLLVRYNHRCGNKNGRIQCLLDRL